MSEPGVVLSVSDGVAAVQLTRNEACAKCGVCVCGSVPDTMLLRAYAPDGTAPGDHVAVEIDRGARSRAHLWLLAVPLADFLAAALVARLVFGAHEIYALLIGLAAMTASFVLAWLLDRRLGWSTRPVARIVKEI